MASSSPDPPAPAAAPRHARDDDAPGSSGRHRRPESLADSSPVPFVPARTSLTVRPAPADRAARSSRAAAAGSRHAADAYPAVEAHPADEAIREARRAASRLSGAREETVPQSTGRRRAENRADSRRTGRRHAGNRRRSEHGADAVRGPADASRRPAEHGVDAFGRPAEHGADAVRRPAERGADAVRRPAGHSVDAFGWPVEHEADAVRRPAERGSHADRPSATRRARHGHRAATPRGRHAMPPDPLSITVRPLRTPSVLRGAEPATGGRPPVIGSRRAPGTLPIESWLLVGKARQQALLAAVVAAGLAMVMIPAAQRGGDRVDPVNAAGTAAVVTEPARKPAAEPPPAARPAPEDRPAAPETTETAGTKPAGTAPAAPAAPTASAAPETPAVVVPPGDGPFRSWRTTGTGTVALTFDDGPDPVQTPRILEMLAAYDVRATFCLVGEQVEKHPEIVGRIVAAGHTLCNHSWDHSLTLGQDSPAVIEADLARTNQAIHRAVPGVPVPFFRAPGGKFSDRLVQTAYRAGMTSLYWEVDPRDWERAKDADDAEHVQKIVAEVRRAVRPGAIVLSHDLNQPATITAYEELLPWLTANFALGVPPAPQPPADS